MMNKNKSFMDGFQDRRKANSDPDRKPKNVKAHLEAKGAEYKKGWQEAGKAKFPK